MSICKCHVYAYLFYINVCICYFDIHSICKIDTLTLEIYKMVYFKKKIFIFRHSLQERLKDTKWVIKNGKSKDRWYNGQKTKDKSTTYDLQNITQKTKDRATWTHKNRGELSCSMCCFYYMHILYFKNNILNITVIKRVIRIRKSKNRQLNGQKKKNKGTNNDLPNTTHKTTDRLTRNPLKS